MDKNNTLETEYGLACKIRDYCGEDVYCCYQCLKCSSGCPMASEMDYHPAGVIRMIKLGQEDILMRSGSIWTCLSCHTCSIRCPNDINISKIMSALRSMAMKKSCTEGKEHIALFHNYFLENIKKRGRLYEAEFLTRYQFMTGLLMKNALLGLDMFLKGRMAVLPESVGDRKAFQKIYERVNKKRAEKCKE